jgi:bifunctional ADP-heptose synthase (sugar kinase/adenylyltransferase)
VKLRYLVEERKVFKVDAARRVPPSSTAVKELIARLEALLPAHDALVVTDFGYGLFGSELCDAVTRLAAQTGKPYFVDVSHTGHANVLKFKRPALATPTEAELRFALGDTESGLSVLASRYFDDTGAQSLVLSMGRRGLLLFGAQRGPDGRLPADHLPSFAPRAVDEVGAGDVLLVLMVLTIAGGGAAATGAYLGSCAAALHINNVGNDPVEAVDLLAALDARPELSGR